MDTVELRAVKFNVLIISAFLLLCSPCYADVNAEHGTLCSAGADNSSWSNTVETNLNDVLNSLSANVHLHNGFFKATAGKGSDKIYGLVQCRGDISSNDCANCTKESMKIASRDCQKSKKAAIWLTWCFLRYSNEKFYGKQGQVSVATNNPDFDDPSVAAQGLTFMRTLASTAAKEPLMFAVSVLDVGQRGKRYGMAQCLRDLSKSDCESCLQNLLVVFGTTIENKRGWELYGLSCSMWYYDFQFYFNVSIPANAAQRSCQGGAMMGITMSVASAFLAMYIS